MKQRAIASFLALGLAVAAVVFVPALRAEADWLLATYQDSADAYAAYAAAWPNGRHAANARLREDERAWQTVERLDTAEAYEGYLLGHASGTFASAASARIDDLAWAAARQERTAPALEGYLRAFPDGRNGDAARIALEDVRWQDAERLNTVDGYLAYLQQQPDGQHRARATAQIDGLRWMAATSEDTVDAYGRYLQEQPVGQFGEVAQARIEDLTWEFTVQAGTREAVEAMLVRWPGGRYVEQARTLIDDLQWRAAIAQGTLRAYRDYLRTAERGLHAAEARARIAALPAPVPNTAYAGRTAYDGTIRLVIGPGSSITSARVSLRGIDMPERPGCHQIIWQDDPQFGLAVADDPDVAIPADALPLPIQNGRLAYMPERPRTVPAVIAGDTVALRIGPNPLPPGPSVMMQIVQVAVRGEFRADRLAGSIQAVFPGLTGCDGPAVPFSAVAVER